MLLTGARITNYRSAVDSTELVIEPDITCLVGKNESGKTAILQGMYKNNPVDQHAMLNETADFPTALSRQRRRMEPDEQIPVSRLTFQLSLGEVAAIESELGSGVMASPEFTVSIGYRDSSQVFELLADEMAAVCHLRTQLDVPLSSYRNVAEAETVTELYNALTSVENPPGSIAKLASLIEDWPDRQLDKHIVTQYLRPNLPRLAYFADYDAMPGAVSIPNLIRRRNSGDLTRGEQALLSLLTLAEIRPEAFCEADQHEQLVRDLEGAANAISDEVFEYWSQSDQLDVTLAVLSGRTDEDSTLKEGPVLQIRMRDRRHRASVPFDERSRGFVWFFSFLAYVTELERADEDMILLLDEPGLYLHGRAQQDLLRLITERLAPRHQVVFSTHSPFMIPANAMDQVRVVTDTAGHGTTVSADVISADSDTTAPLVTSMAVELGRTLLTGEHTLLISHPSDLIHLEILSSLLKMRGRAGLDSRWNVTPVGGAHRLATLCAVTGVARLGVAVLANSDSWDDSSYLGRNRIVEIGDFTGRRKADVEDLYEPDFYLALVSHAYTDHLAMPINSVDLSSDGSRIIERVAEYFAVHDIAGGEFNRFHTAATLLKVQSAFLPEVDPVTLTRAERLFARLNEMLP